MKDYTDVLISHDAEKGNSGLIKDDFTFGDWLAQDGICPQALAGATDLDYIINVYYYNSVNLTAKAAKVLGYENDAQKYEKQAKIIYNAILDDFFSVSGRLSINTQTGYVLSLHYGIYRSRERMIKDFSIRLKKDFYKLKGGFTGVPLLLTTLFDCGMDNEAYRILYNEGFPGWLYCVNLGATTIWERWNSLLPDGKISGIWMNSFNHYAYGSVCEAIYSRIAGLKNNAPGWQSAIIEPHPNYRMKKIDLSYDSPFGKYSVAWETLDGEFVLKCVIPGACTAKIILPNGEEHNVSGGTYTYTVKRDYTRPFSIDTPNMDLLENEKTRALYAKIMPEVYERVIGENEEFLPETPNSVYFSKESELEEFNKELAKVQV
jgi:alpha-L-rhamnosidase